MYTIKDLFDLNHTLAKEYLEQFLADGRDPAFIGEPIPLETYMHRSWEAFTKEGF